MTAVKVECDCGQRYAFDVEPVHGRMPAPVACPICGADGTAKANAVLAQAAPSLVSIPAPAPFPAARLAVAAPVAPLPVAAAIPYAAVPPSLPRPVVAAPPLPPRAAVAIPGLPPVPPVAPGNEGVCVECGGVFPMQSMIKYGTSTVCAACKPVFLQKLAQNTRGQKTRGKDGWNGPETTLNKAGQYIAFIPALLAAVIAWRFLHIPAIVLFLAAFVGVFGIVGGILNILGRGPIWAGALVGLVTTISGFFTVSWWIRYRQGDAWWIEVIIAFVIGCLPGILLQPLLQKLLRGKSA